MTYEYESQPNIQESNVDLGLQKQIEYGVGWNGDDGRVSIDKLLEAISLYFPGLPLSSVAMTRERESTIIVFEKIDPYIVNNID